MLGCSAVNGENEIPTMNTTNADLNLIQRAMSRLKNCVQKLNGALNGAECDVRTGSSSSLWRKAFCAESRGRLSFETLACFSLVVCSAVVVAGSFVGLGQFLSHWSSLVKLVENIVS